MSLLALNDARVSFGAHDILHDITCEVNPGDRIGLVGRNGAGKTTLLHVLDGSLGPTGGGRNVARAIRSALVEQVLRAEDASVTLNEEALSAIRDLLDLERELEVEAGRMEAEGAQSGERYAGLLAEFEARGGYTWPNRLEQILDGLGFDAADRAQAVASLSGGQRGRLALAKGLLAQPDILLMDEPTNHLDLSGMRWLETFLTRWKGALIIASHDRQFLDTVATRIWHVDDGRLTVYTGNYSQFVEQRAEQLLTLRKQYESQRDFIAREEAFIRRYRAGQKARQAAGRATRLARLERVAPVIEGRSLNLEFKTARSGDIVLTSRALSTGYDEKPILQVGSLEFFRGDRIALVGPNGSGKSTLLKTLARELTPTGGSVSLGSGVRIALYHQEADNLNGKATVLEEVMSSGTIDPQRARDLLGMFLFSGMDVEKRVDALSGGERGRLAIAKLSLTRANLLLLDEPTNHLDIPSREALEEAMEAYPGTLVFASHDRRLVDSIATRLLMANDGIITELDGGIEAYEGALQASRARPEPVKREREVRSREPKPERLVAAIEDKIGALEAEQAEVMRALELAGARSDVTAIAELGRRFETNQAELDRLLEEWSELAGALA